MTRPVSAAAAACLLGGLWVGPLAVAQDSSPQLTDAVPVTRGLDTNGSAGTLSPPGSAVDEVNEALLPYGELTPYEPLKKSLDDLLQDGWQLDQATGDLQGFTLLLSNSGRRALCVLVPRDLGQDDEALVDCRRLN
jgi:hypothetical protein